LFSSVLRAGARGAGSTPAVLPREAFLAVLADQLAVANDIQKASRGCGSK
jgi:hypothetical protein